MSNKSVKSGISNQAFVHKTAVLLGEEITLEEDVYIGPYCVIEGNVILKKGVRLVSHVVVSGNTTVGEGTTIYSFASIGSIPQDIKYNGEKSYTEIGKNNIIREHVTINSGTEHGGLYTKIGDNNLLMIACHIGHDCHIGNNCVIANNVGIAGHVLIEDSVIVGGNSGIHQFVRIGANVMIGGMSGVGLDIPPYSLYTGTRGDKLRGLNIVGLKRHGFSSEEIKSIKNAFEFIFANGNIFENAKTLLDKGVNEKVKKLVDFILASKTRNICTWDKTARMEE
jgi:UDP-N-acetylglucosamine acyltransferase